MNRFHVLQARPNYCVPALGLALHAVCVVGANAQQQFSILDPWCYGTNQPISVTGIAEIAAAGAMLVIAWVFGDFSYETIAKLGRFNDHRVAQVSDLYGYWLAFLWVVGVAWRISAWARMDHGKGQCDPHGKRSLYRLFAIALCVCASTIIFGVLLIGFASIPPIIVTPPEAWLIIMPGNASLDC